MVDVVGRRGPAVVSDTVAITVHGPDGVVDLLVPQGAVADDVAREYAAQCGSVTVPALHTRAGRALDPRESLAEAGLPHGALLVAAAAPAPTTSVRPRDGAGATRQGPPEDLGGPLSLTWCAVAVAAAALAGWFATHAEGPRHDVTVLVLAGTAALAVIPLGARAPHRVAAAPAFGAAAAFASVWAPQPERLPTIVGVSALVAAVTAGLARTLGSRSHEVLGVWVVAGVALFVLTGAGALAGVAPQVVWGALLVLAMLAARFVPGLVLHVPDQLLIDVERLAATAWSARERPRGRRRRTVVRPDDVAVMATRASRSVTAAACAIWACAALSAPMLLVTADLPVDRVGARVLAGLAGAALLLAARSYRHPGARAMLRAAGLTCWAALLVVVLGRIGGEGRSWLAAAALALAVLLVVVAVATGRGWRSAWWSRRADVVESVAGAAAIAALIVASGLFRTLWETQFRV